MMFTVSLTLLHLFFSSIPLASSFVLSTTRRLDYAKQDIQDAKFYATPHTTTSRTIDLFLPNDDESQAAQAEKDLISWFDNFIKSTDYFKRKVDEFSHSAGAFHVPAFNTTISLNKTSTSKYTITSEGNNEGGYGVLIAKIFESQKKLKHIDDSNLRQAVKQYFEFVRPTTGIDASITANPRVDQYFDKAILNELSSKGFICLDTDIMTSKSQRRNLSSLLRCKPGTSRLAMLSQHKAHESELEEHYDFLMGIAHYFNWNMEWNESDYEALSPATQIKPLTNPSIIEIAEYGHDQFRDAQSDNILLDSNIRKNYRMYTCVLCCNNNWDSSVDGGAIRIYPNTMNITNPDKALSMSFEDINPSNGKLIILDSRLVYSIEKVLSKENSMRTMTLWISKPENNGVSINIWDDLKDRVDWTRMF
jgi:hypothetical protein